MMCITFVWGISLSRFVPSWIFIKTFFFSFDLLSSLSFCLSWFLPCLRYLYLSVFLPFCLCLLSDSLSLSPFQPLIPPFFPSFFRSFVSFIFILFPFSLSVSSLLSFLFSVVLSLCYLSVFLHLFRSFLSFYPSFFILVPSFSFFLSLHFRC